MTRLLIARHGNTFDKGEPVLRVGMRTDLPLSRSGNEQASRLGVHLMKMYPEIAKIYTSHLKRTIQTGRHVLDAFDRPIPMEALACFNEVDYGVDEGKPEEEVVARMGQEMMRRWESEHIPPEGWKVDPEALKSEWLSFLARIEEEHPDETILVVTSQSIARFLPYAIDPEDTTSGEVYKLKTSAVSEIQYREGAWQLIYWNHTVPEWASEEKAELNPA